MLPPPQDKRCVEKIVRYLSLSRKFQASDSNPCQKQCLAQLAPISVHIRILPRLLTAATTYMSISARPQTIQTSPLPQIPRKNRAEYLAFPCILLRHQVHMPLCFRPSLAHQHRIRKPEHKSRIWKGSRILPNSNKLITLAAAHLNHPVDLFTVISSAQPARMIPGIDKEATRQRWPSRGLGGPSGRGLPTRTRTVPASPRPPARLEPPPTSPGNVFLSGLAGG